MFDKHSTIRATKYVGKLSMCAKHSNVVGSKMLNDNVETCNRGFPDNYMTTLFHAFAKHKILKTSILSYIIFYHRQTLINISRAQVQLFRSKPNKAVLISHTVISFTVVTISVFLNIGLLFRPVTLYDKISRLIHKSDLHMFFTACFVSDLIAFLLDISTNAPILC